jgi:dihydroorotate dehydrogenase electron transfer subunit
VNTPVQITAPVAANDTAMPGVNLLWLEAPEIAAIAKPGQFVMLKCQGGAFLRRPLSIHRLSADKNQVAFLFAVVGKGTAWLAGLKPGEAVDLLGPMGNGFNIALEAESAVLLAGGLGVAPLAFWRMNLKLR